MNKAKYQDFYLETSRDQLKKMSALFLAWEKKPQDSYLLEDILSLLHAIKGAAATMDYQATNRVLHIVEDIFYAILHKSLEPNRNVVNILFNFLQKLEENFNNIAKSGKEISWLSSTKNLQNIFDKPTQKLVKKVLAKDNTFGALNHSRSFFRTPLEVVVPTYRLDKIQSIVDNLSISKLNLSNVLSKNASASVLKACVNIDKVLGDLRREVAQLRLLPVSQIFAPLPRLVRQLAQEEGKKVDLILEDNNLSLDKAVLDDLMDIIIQLLRNAVVHGIAPEQKNGQIIVSLELVDDQIKLTVADNGHGIDWQQVIKLSVAKKIISSKEAKTLTEKEAKRLLFSNRFSTQTLVTLNSGRGVGLSLVKQRVGDLDGQIVLNSSKGHGARFIISLPLMTSVLRALIFRLGDYLLAVPLSSVDQVIRLNQLEKFNRDKFFTYKKVKYPLVSFAKIVGVNLSLVTQNILLLKFNSQSFLLPVPQNMREEEIVIKRQPKVLRNHPSISNVALASDGQVVLLLDLYSLIENL